MNILVSANDKYIMPLTVMLTSLLENNRNTGISVYFLYSDVSAENFRILEDMIQSSGQTLIPVRIPEQVFSSLKTAKRISRETFFRLLVTKYVPADVKRILWLDCDIIVRGDLSGLYHTELDGCSLAGCERTDRMQASFKQYFEKFGLPEPVHYINAGVLLMDLETLRQMEMETLITECIEKYGADSFKYADQDLINIIFRGKIRLLDYREYNLMTNAELYTAGLSCPDRCVVIHYAGRLKPWQFTDVPFADIWKQYYDRSPFKGKELRRIRAVALSEMVWRSLAEHG